jgi:phytoene desaturase
VFDDLRSGRLMSDPSFMVTNPTRTNPALAPPRRQIYSVLFPAPNLDAPIDWARIGPRYREHVLGTLAARGYPWFADAIEVEHVTTPADWARRGMAAGTPFAAAHTLGQTGPFRPGNRWGENVVFAGSGTRPGGRHPDRADLRPAGRGTDHRPRPAYRSRAWR